MRVLVVDDDALYRDMVQTAFISLGIEVICARDAMMALLEIQSARQPIHLILTDYRMPGMNGIEFVKKLNERRSLYPVIIWSSDFSEEALAEIEELAKGMQIRSVNKSGRMKELAEMIRSEIVVWRNAKKSER